jgi:hypothetical protein
MSAKHGIAGAVFLVLMTGPVLRAQIPTDLPFVKPPSPMVDNPVSGPSGYPIQPGQTPTSMDYPRAGDYPFSSVYPLGQQPPASYPPGPQQQPMTGLPGQQPLPAETFGPNPTCLGNGPNPS